MQPLDVYQIPLKNYNLIEASAGTGKTYSIALLTLRIILETDIAIHQILMVTFTKAAVAELQIRVRKFVQLADSVIAGEQITDSNIHQVVVNSIELSNQSTVEKRIKNAQLLLDEIAIMTIHSFCQQTLNEFAFESNQMFGTEMATDDTALITFFVNQYWRNYITSLSIDIIRTIDGSNFVDHITSIIKEHLNGKPLKWYEESTVYHLPLHTDEYNDATKTQIIGHAIQYITAAIVAYKAKYNILSFNDLINHLANALKGDKQENLVAALQKKYKAVFVDEFQDTDKKQYAIFKTAFSKNTIVFLIGDPKQSIYAFRQADLFIYFQAKHDAAPNIFTMNTNYRSMPRLIRALNTFFKPHTDFDTFHFQNSAHTLSYYPVHPAKKEADESMLYINDAPNTPIDIIIKKNKEEITQSVIDHVLSLLSSKAHYYLDGHTHKPIQPQQIGIITRQNKTGIEIKKRLNSIGIPAVMADETKVFQTYTATELYYILTAIQQPSVAHINRALLSDICHYNLNTITAIQLDNFFVLFQQYLDIWQHDGIYAVILKLVEDFKLKKRIETDSSNKEQRQYINLMQLTEIVHKAQITKHLSLPETLLWYHNLLSGKIPAADEHILRIENDDDAVQITTIHKSKGLEFDIVLLPELDFTLNKKYFSNKELLTINEQLDNYNSQYYSLHIHDATEEDKAIILAQAEQENRRLIYVALTRARHKLYIYSTALKTKSPGTLSGLLAFGKTLLKESFDQSLINLNCEDVYSNAGSYINSQQSLTRKYKVIDLIQLRDNNWMKLSYSAIAQHPTSPGYQRLHAYPNSYDYFIFHQLQLGAYTGIIIHNLLERLDFQQDKYWQKNIEKMARISSTKEESHTQHLLAMLHHICETVIEINQQFIQLKMISNHQKLTELEFYFPLNDLQIHRIQQLNISPFQWNTKHFDIGSIKGFMNGMIDLLFEYNNQYYILDWKTNFLGDYQAAYSTTNIVTAMNDNNYHLQYMIYILAVNKYLSQRIIDYDYDTHFGGVIYLFIRGIRTDATDGIFTHKPPAALVNALASIVH